MRLARFEWGCLGVILAAAILRVTFILQPAFIWDSAWFLMLARSFGESGTFYIRWSEPDAPLYSGYWPPLFPIFVSPLVKLFGPNYHVLVLGSALATTLLVLGVFLMTRDLFDRSRAFAAAAVVAATPAFYSSDARGMSESLLGLMVALTVWAFVKSLTKPLWLPVAGVFAFLSYLGKASLGLPFVAAGVLALAGWRIHRRGWRALIRSPVDMGVVLAGLVGMLILASTRTERVGGLGLGLIEPLKRGVLQADCGELAGQLVGAPAPFHAFGPQCWLLAFPLKIAFVAAFLFVVLLPLSLRLPQLVRQPRTERTDALWLAVLLPLIAGAVFTTTFFFTEHRNFVDFDNIRYLTPALVPFLWLLLPLWTFDDEPQARDTHVRRRHVTVYWIAMTTLVALLLLNPVTGTLSLTRFVVLLVLALVPIGISLYARLERYTVQERRVGNTLERRYVRGRTPGEHSRTLVIVGIVLAIGGLLFSSWYALVAIGLIVALATPSPGRRLVAMSLILLVSAAPAIGALLPTDAMTRATATMPEGTVIGMSELVVYPAAVAPDNLAPRLVDPNAGIAPEVQLLLMQSEYSDREFANFTKVVTWDYEFSIFPTLQGRLWIEENLLGITTERQRVPGLTLYVREGSGLEAYVLR
jgi:4-amino-4-deoxy-L-arabinose transferase-like glycosyltransferase